MVDDIPGAEQILEAIKGALEGLTRTIATTAAASVPKHHVLRRYAQRGHPLSRLADIRNLDLEVSDEAFPRQRRLAYIIGAGATGAWAGTVTTAGEIGTVVGGVAGAGAGATPGAMTVVGAFAGDAAATLLAGSRIIAETAALYGYDPNDPAEQMYMAGVLGAATAGTQTGKMAAQRELHKLAYSLARNAPWTTLGKNRITPIVARVYQQLGHRLTKQQLGKATPVLGVVVGAGLNMRLMHRVADEAYFAYRERRLRDRYGDEDESFVDNAPPSPSPDAEGYEPAAGDADEHLPLLDLAESAAKELEKETSAEPTPPDPDLESDKLEEDSPPPPPDQQENQGPSDKGA